MWTLRRRWAVLSALAVAACAPCSFEKRPALKGSDGSQPFRRIRGRVTIRLQQDATVSELRRTAKVAEIRPKREERIVVLAGNGPESNRSFRIQLPGDLPLPFAQGDPIAVVVSERQWSFAKVFDGVIVDPTDGAVLLANSLTGDATLVPGWDFVRGPVIGVVSSPHTSGGACLFEHDVTLSHGGQAARLRRAEWRTISVAGRTWAVTGSAFAYGAGFREPDSMDVSTFTIVRIGSR
ncbi:MAG: hypothetical protein JW940_16830 [Polyangiaceae bacterium]|nr:hypothetical protein [Polyangiaceae bacterium]